MVGRDHRVWWDVIRRGGGVVVVVVVVGWGGRRMAEGCRYRDLLLNVRLVSPVARWLR